MLLTSVEFYSLQLGRHATLAFTDARATLLRCQLASKPSPASRIIPESTLAMVLHARHRQQRFVSHLTSGPVAADSRPRKPKIRPSDGRCCRRHPNCTSASRRRTARTEPTTSTILSDSSSTDEARSRSRCCQYGRPPSPRNNLHSFPLVFFFFFFFPKRVRDRLFAKRTLG